MTELVTTNKEITNNPPSPEQTSVALEKAAEVMISGNLSRMTQVEKAGLLSNLAKGLGLNAFPPPFAITKTRDGREIIYALKSCSDQLRKLYGVGLEVKYQGPLLIGETSDPNVYLVKVQAKLPDGRMDEDCGTVWIKGLVGEDLANAIMKAVTKAKRRVTFSILGLSLMDETEVETIRQTSSNSGPRRLVPGQVGNGLGSLPPVEAEVVKPESANGLPPVAAPGSK